MSKKNSNKFIGVLSIFIKSIKTYFMYLDQIYKYISFPILGQIIGLFLILICTYYFTLNIDKIVNISPFFQNPTTLLILILIVLLPFFLIFLKAIYEYTIAFSALNIFFYTNSNKKRIQNIDFGQNKKIIERKLFQYIILLLLVSIIMTMPPLLFIAPVIWIFLCLCFQVFALQPEASAFDALSSSFKLIKGNIIPTIILLLLCYVTTYWFLPNMFIWTFEKISLYSLLVNLTEKFIQCINLDTINSFLSIANTSIDYLTIAKYITDSLISFIVIGYTLPFRCCCFTELYKIYDSEKIKDFSKNSEEIIHRATNKKRKNY